MDSRERIPLDQRRLQKRGIPCDARAPDAAADHDHIMDSACEGVQVTNRGDLTVRAPRLPVAEPHPHLHGATRQGQTRSRTR